MAEVDVGRLDELSEGVPHIVSVGSREIAVVRWREQVYAVKNSCPHQTVSFGDGVAVERIVGCGALGEVTVDASDPALRCPRHGWRFGMASGRCTNDPRLRVRTYEVTVRDGRIYLETGRAKAAARG